MDVNYIRHYDSLELQQMDDDTYATIEPKEEEDPLKIRQSGKSMAVAEHSDTIKFQEEDDYVIMNETGTTVEMDVEGDYERLDIQNIDDATYEDLRTKKEKEPQNKIPQCDMANKRVGVVIGLFCAVLSLLIIVVPLYLYQSNMAERGQLVTRYNQLQARTNNLTAERDQLQSGFNQLQTSFNQLQTRHKNLTEERDDLKMRLCESPGWQKFDSGCYYISRGTRPWEKSRQWCRDRQSDLIVINSQEKQDFVERVNKTVWLGLTDREGSFKWVDGTPLTTPTYWRIWEPNKNGLCVQFYDGALPDYPERGWDDKPCSDNFQWICEKVLN